MKIITIEEEEVWQQLNSRVNAIADYLKRLDDKSYDDLWLNNHEVCQYLHISEKTLWRMRTKDEIGYFKIYGQYFYTIGAIKVDGLVKDRKIANVARTAEWELALQKIENNEADAGAFQKEMEHYASSITNELLQTSIAQNNLPKLVCPKCKSQQLIIRDKIVKCPDEACNWVQFRNVCGVQISIADIENLVNKGKTSLIKGMKSKAGKKFDAYIVLNENGKTSFEFEQRKKK